METADSRKSFERIHDDYGFFLQHSNEPEICRTAMLRAIREKFSNSDPLRMMDFGCGGGEFLERLLQDFDFPCGKLDLNLVEVDPTYLESARKRVGRFSNRLPHISATAGGIPGKLDLITSNHVLYYVRDLAATLGLLKSNLREGGLGICILGGKGNQLCRLWELAFRKTGHELPYYLAEDVGLALSESGLSFVKEELHSVLRFPDTVANRGKILRFLFEGKLEGMDSGEWLGLMDGWVVGDEIVMENRDCCYLWSV